MTSSSNFIKHTSDATDNLFELFKDFPMEDGLTAIITHIFRIIFSIWHYPIFITDNHKPVAISNVIIALFFFYLRIKASKYLSSLIKEKTNTIFSPEPSVASAIEKISYYILLVVSSCVALEIANVPLTAFTFIGGALAIGLGFGSQNIINNFISGLIIMLEQPIRIGDVIECDKFIGQIINIGARCTHIITTDNIDIIVPNSTLLQSTIINLTLSEGAKVRKTLEITIALDNDIELFRQMIIDFLSQSRGIVKESRAEVYLINIENFKATFKVRYWIDIMGDVGNNELVNDLFTHLYNSSKNGLISFSYDSNMSSCANSDKIIFNTTK